MGMVHGISDVVHVLEKVLAELQKNTQLLERVLAERSEA